MIGMRFSFKQPLISGEKRCVMTQITAAKETRVALAILFNAKMLKFINSILMLCEGCTFNVCCVLSLLRFQ